MQTRIRPFRSHRTVTSFASAALVACAASVRAGDLIVEGSLTVETNLTVQGRTTLGGRLNLGGNDITNAGVVRAVRFVGDGGGLTNCVDDAAQDLALKFHHYGTAEVAITPASQFTFDGAGTITAFVGNAPDVVIPYEIGSIPVTSVGTNAFKNKGVVLTVVLPNSITTIRSCAFMGCSNLVSVAAGNALEKLESSAFNGCKALTAISLPDTLQSIGNGAFHFCHALTAANLGRGLTTIAPIAFRCCISLPTITIPAGVTNIGAIAFASCSNLVEVVFEGDCPAAIDSIYTSASNVVNYVSADASGWGAEFCGRPVVRPNLTADALAARSLQVETIQVTHPASEPGDAVNYQTLTNQLAAAAYVRDVVNGGTSGTTGEVGRVGDVVTVTFPAVAAGSFPPDGSVPISGSLLVETNLAVGGEATVPVLRAGTLRAGQFVNTNNLDTGTQCAAPGGAMNVVSSRWSVVAGGAYNAAGSGDSDLYGEGGLDAVAGGGDNKAIGGFSVVGGGMGNRASGWQSAVLGGGWNAANRYASVVGGGEGNEVSASGSMIGGGSWNYIGRGSDEYVGANLIGAGSNNWIGNTNWCSSILGGGANSISDSCSFSTIGGGIENLLTGSFGVISGGSANQAAGASAVGGGFNNTALGGWSTIPGGYYNSATGTHSFAAGLRAHALHGGSFVWNGQATGTPSTPAFASTAANQFLVRASGGVGINTNVTSGYALRVAGDADVTGKLVTKQLTVTQAASTPSDAVNYQTLTNQLAAAAYVRDVVNGGTAGTTGEVTRAGDIVTVRFPASSANAFAADGSVPLTGNLLFAGGPRAIAPTTLDGADSGFTAISGGGLPPPSWPDLADTSRGATVWTLGNENETYPGQLWLSGGHATGAVDAGAIIVTTADDDDAYRRRLVIDPAAPASFEGDRVANVGDALDDQDAVNRRSAQAMIAAALQAVGPFGDVSMGCYTNRP